MKILPIQNFSTISPQQTRANNNHTKFASNQLSSDMVVLQNKPKKKSISFGNLNETAITLAKQLPLEDRIASLFDVFKRGDIITVGKNLKETQRALKNSLDSLDHVIKRIFFIEDDNIQGSLAFYKNATGDKEILNINNFDLYLSNSTGQEALKPVAIGENAFYTDQFKLAVAPKNKPSLILHELGHAINAHKGKFLKFLQKSRMFVSAVPTALIMLNGLSKQDDNKPSFIERNAGKIGFAAFLPTIIEEGLASIRGVKAAKATLGNSVNLKPLKRNYFFAWLTYLIAGIGLGVAAKQSVIENKR